MKHCEIRRLNELFNDWLSFEEKQAELNDICRSGPTQEGKTAEYKGDFPQLSVVKPDVLSIKVERARRIVIEPHEKRAAMLINAFPIRLRAILTEHHKRRNRNNPQTNNRYTHKDIAYLLSMSFERYKLIHNQLCELLLSVDKDREVDKAVIFLKYALKSPIKRLNFNQ